MPTITALEIISDAYGRCNRLSPGETLNADDSGHGLTQLNLLADEINAGNQFLYKNIIVSASQTGNITLGAGSWAAIDPGSEIVSATANNIPMSPMTMQQYNELYKPTPSGTPNAWAANGLGVIYFDLSPSAVTINLYTRTGVADFADQTTSYTVPHGYKSYLGAALAIRIAPKIMGKVPQFLIDMERSLRGNIEKYDPAILDVNSFTRSTRRSGGILNGW